MRACAEGHLVDQLLVLIDSVYALAFIPCPAMMQAELPPADPEIFEVRPRRQLTVREQASCMQESPS